MKPSTLSSSAGPLPPLFLQIFGFWSHKIFIFLIFSQSQLESEKLETLNKHKQFYTHFDFLRLLRELIFLLLSCRNTKIFKTPCDGVCGKSSKARQVKLVWNKSSCSSGFNEDSESLNSFKVSRFS
jgi:hypothetical protein